MKTARLLHIISIFFALILITRSIPLVMEGMGEIGIVMIEEREKESGNEDEMTATEFAEDIYLMPKTYWDLISSNRSVEDMSGFHSSLPLSVFIGIPTPPPNRA